jgi:predicted DNA-binding transcriptional regulator AlpA
VTRHATPSLIPRAQKRKRDKYSRSHIYRLVKAKKFPAPVKPSGTPNGANAWFDDEIDEHLEARATEREVNQP